MEDEIKVSELPLATQVNNDDLLMIIQGQANKKLSKEVLQNTIINAIPEKKLSQEYILVELTADSTLSTSAVIPFDTISKNTSTRLSLDTTNHAIVIGAGIAEVEVSGMIFVEDTNTTPLYFWGDIRQNGTELMNTICDTSTNYGTGAFTPFPIEVTENDKIDIYKRTSASQKIRSTKSTFMMVKVTKEV